MIYSNLFKMSHQSNAEAVLEFTVGAGQQVATNPSPMSKDEVKFIGKMILDEVLELYATVMDPEEAKKSLGESLDKAKCVERVDGTDVNNVVAEQADALVDIWYYSLNAACKKGVNLSSLFDIVQAANMAKKDPATGTFLKREDGKIIKPPGWTPPDVAKEIVRQKEQGAFKAETNGCA